MKGEKCKIELVSSHLRIDPCIVVNDYRVAGPSFGVGNVTSSWKGSADDMLRALSMGGGRSCEEAYALYTALSKAWGEAVPPVEDEP